MTKRSTMFRRSRVKIIAAVMAALLLFLLVALAVIYGTSYHQIQQDNMELLTQFSQRFSLKDRSSGTSSDIQEPPEIPSGPGGPADGNPMEGFLEPRDNDMSGGDRGSGGPGARDRDHAFEISTFYYIALSDSGEVLASDFGSDDTYSEEYLTELAEELVAGNKAEGKVKGLMYLITEKDGYDLIAFMDNSTVRDNMATLLNNTLISFCISVVIVFLLSLFLSKRIIAPLEENDARQKQFISDAGHELKTPLAVMSTNCELLSREIGDNPWLSNIEYENERMSLLVKELLDLSHAESGISVEEDVDYSNLVIGEALPFESIAFEKGLILDTRIQDGIRLIGNPGQLRQLTAILLDNAIDHSEGGKDILLTLASDKRNAILKVTNYGKEIPSDKIDKLFERFYKVDEARTEDGSNHYGLGLAIAKAIVQAHHGTIGITSKEGKVTFTVTLPIKK